jgi:hypothetical protein
MKTLRLNRAESIAYANGERRFWKEVVPMHSQKFWLTPDTLHSSPGGKAAWIRDVLYWQFFHPMAGKTGNDKESPLTCIKSLYGKPGDHILLRCRRDELPPVVDVVKSITVEQRGGRWGWVLEVGA